MTTAKSSATSALSWVAQKARLKTKFPQLTDADLNFDVAEKFVMLTRLQVKTGRTAKELQSIIEKT
jgi:hypothetical protein